jgi:quercetin dioxygenase-like cupin family protein
MWSTTSGIGPSLVAACVKIRQVQHWDLRSIDAPRGTRDPYVVHQDAGARAVLVALEPGQALGEHQVKENAWVVVIDGNVEVTADGRTVELGTGGLLRFEPGERHTVASAGGARFLMVLTPWPGAGPYAEE